MSTLFVTVISILLIIVALLVKPIRKTIGLLFVILGCIVSLTYIGMIIGIPLIVIGGLMLFI